MAAAFTGLCTAAAKKRCRAAAAPAMSLAARLIRTAGGYSAGAQRTQRSVFIQQHSSHQCTLAAAVRSDCVVGSSTISSSSMRAACSGAHGETEPACKHGLQVTHARHARHACCHSAHGHAAWHMRAACEECHHLMHAWLLERAGITPCEQRDSQHTARAMQQHAARARSMQHLCACMRLALERKAPCKRRPCKRT